jgi:hypothetical protein
VRSSRTGHKGINLLSRWLSGDFVPRAIGASLCLLPVAGYRLGVGEASDSHDEAQQLSSLLWWEQRESSRGTPKSPTFLINTMNSRLRQLMDQGTVAPGDRVRYVDHAGGDAVYEATLDRHGNIICYGSLHQHHRSRGGAATDLCGPSVLVFSSASHFVRHCARLDSRPNSRHYSSLYVNGVAWPDLTTSHRARPQLSSREANGRSKCVATHLLFKAHQHCLYGGTLLRKAPSRAPQPVTQRHPPPAQPRPGITGNATMPMRQRERRKKSATSYGPPLWLSLQHQFQPRGQRQSPKTPTSPEHEELALLAWPATLFCAPPGEGAAVQPETPP